MVQKGGSRGGKTKRERSLGGGTEAKKNREKILRAKETQRPTHSRVQLRLTYSHRHHAKRNQPVLRTLPLGSAPLVVGIGEAPVQQRAAVGLEEAEGRAGESVGGFPKPEWGGIAAGAPA